MDERYFAYGSNLWIDQMVARTGALRDGAERPQIARLADHRLAFNMHWDDGQVFANLTQPGNGVYGVVYTCSPESLTRLEALEAGYERGNVRVILDDGVEWRGQRYRSLSVVAREITGARWSGPRFFGLKADFLYQSRQKK